jgi:flagellar biogenesis protein FliO
MKSCNHLIFILALVFSTSAFTVEKVKLEKIVFNKSIDQGTIVLKLDKSLPETPELTVKASMIQIAIPGSYVWPKIERKVSTLGKEFDTTLLAYQYDKDLVRFRIMVPYQLKGQESKITLSLNDDEVILKFPITKVKSVNEPSGNIVQVPIERLKKTTKEIAKQNDEGYLNDLLAEKKTVKLKDDFFKSKYDKTKSKKLVDQVSLGLSATKKTNNFLNTKKKTEFSISNYVGKFVAFLGLILLFFYGIVHLMKKGVLKKGKLGFLNDTNIVEVLNTTYLGPKKSLLLVKVHKQVFLLSSTDKGMEFISELNDTAGLLKEGELAVSGHNFDNSLETASNENKRFKIKELTKGLSSIKDMKESKEEAGLEEFLAKAEAQVSDKVKLSDQIKNKMKNLKQIQ